MNTTPDETMLALWLDDELDGEQFAAVEAWAQSRPEQLAAREEVRRWRSMVRAAVPATVEPPYPDFFNSRIERSIRDLQIPAQGGGLAVARPWWSNWLLPASAVAGMVFTFWMGAQSSAVHRQGTHSVYTPESGVDAEWFASAPASATVIVLQGVEAIPDSLDFGGTASLVPVEEDRAIVAVPGWRGGGLTQ
jgi:hypothetical protein